MNFFKNINLRGNKILRGRVDMPTHPEEIASKEYVDTGTVYKTTKAQTYTTPFKFNWLSNLYGKNIRDIFDDLFFPRILPTFLNPIFSEFEMRAMGGINPKIIVIGVNNNLQIDCAITPNDRSSSQVFEFNIGSSTFNSDDTSNEFNQLKTDIVPMSTEVSISKVFNASTPKPDTYNDDYLMPGFNMPYTLQKTNYPDDICLMLPMCYSNLNLQGVIDSVGINNNIITNSDLIKFNNSIIMQPNVTNVKTLLIPKKLIDGQNIIDKYNIIFNGTHYPNFDISNFDTIELEWTDYDSTVYIVEYYIKEIDFGYYTSPKQIYFEFVDYWKNNDNTVINAGGGGGISIHNDLTGIQGGSPNEYYHFNEIQQKKLLSLIHTNGTSSISVSPSSGERGVNATLTVNYNITSNDDVFGTATINQGIGDVTVSIDSGNQSTSGGNSSINKSFTMSLSYTRNGDPKTENKTTTYNTYIPQWAGWSAEEDFADNYSSINSEINFQKYIQSSANINKVNSPTGEYIWFISNKNNAIIKDTNDFVQSVGTWGDGTSEFYQKPLTLTLADGITTVTVYLYRSRNVKTLSAFTYKIS